MFGFGKKKEIKNKAEKNLGVELHTIPDIFYGGNDPVIYHQSSPKEVSVSVTKSATKKNSQKKMVPHVTQRGTNSWVEQHKKLLFWGGGSFVVLLVTAGATWYYVNQARQQVAQPVQHSVAPTTTVRVDISTPIITEPVVTSTPTSTLDATTTEDIANIQAVDPVSFPRILLVNSEDTDADQLTDEEEVVFNTNQDKWDTDDDGYYDGQEIVNLYNPSGFAPVKLIDSGLVKEYVSQQWQYRVYYPATWQIGTVDTAGRQVLASTLSGDFVELRVFDRVPTQSFQDWFALNIEGETFQDIQTITNRFQEQGFLRRDGLVAYFMSSNTVTVLIYHPGLTGAVPYRTVMRMMVESFRPTANGVALPDQQVLPTPPGQDALGETATTSTSTTSTTTQ